MRDDAKQQVLQATDIVGLIGEHVALTARGREFVGLCPFHDDHKPSMNVVPAKQIYKCFSCGAGGDAFSFVMDYHRMTFPEALRHLADRAKIRLPNSGGRSGDSEDAPSPRRLILQANEHAADFFRQALRHDQTGAVARRYLADRGIAEEMIEAFGIGYAPDQWDALSRQMTAKGWSRDGFEQAGLVSARKSGNGHFDRFRHRLIFPIRDGLGRPLAFGGRTLPGGSGEHDSDAKYLNSPEHIAFNKSAVLFGLHLAQKPIIDSHTVIIVEGYTDVIACHQAGFRNVVATMGTALTAGHAGMLRRYADRVVLVFDADEAGQKAADRALQVFFHEPLDIDIAVLPEGLDPADLLAKDNGPDRWRTVIDQAADAMTFQFHRVRRSFDQADSLAGRQRVTEDYLRTLVQLGLHQLDRRRYGLIFARIAELLGMTPSRVNESLKRITESSPSSPTRTDRDDDTPEAEKLDALQRAERLFLGCLISRCDLFHADLPDGRPISETILPAEFTGKRYRRLYHALYEWLLDHEELPPAGLRDATDEETLVRLALDAQAEVDQLTGSDGERLNDLFMRAASAVDRYRAEQQYEHQKMQMRESRTAGEADPQAAEHNELLSAIAHINANPTTRRMPRPIG